MVGLGYYCTVGLVIGFYYYLQARRDANKGMDIAKAVMEKAHILVVLSAFLWPIMVAFDITMYIEHKREVRQMKKAVIDAIRECPEGGSVVFEKGDRRE